MDVVIKRRRDSAGLAIEDKSPKVFGKHCTNEEVDTLCGNEVLHLNDREHGFRSIFFKVCRYLLASFSDLFDDYCS